ncbi:MAG: ribonuclease HII [Blastocatellia bacterium]
MPRRSSTDRISHVEISCTDQFEQLARVVGAQYIAGVDEVGRGALAGPVVAAAVILDPARIPAGLNDSKQLPRAVRERLSVEIQATALTWAIARVEADEIDRINILAATKKAMRQAIAQLSPAPDHLLIDAVRLEGLAVTQQPIIRGDAQSVSIAAASIIAKVARDSWMREYAEAWPQYGFGSNVGYGAAVHLQALRENGPTAIHRLSFRGVLPARTLFDDLGS